jgi:hypothetical protein
MPNFGTYAICPYFETEDQTAIKCEGIVQLNQVDTVYQLRFPNKTRKKDHLQMYCETYQYGKCPYAAVLNKSYEER